jgi:hypothetical protein
VVKSKTVPLGQAEQVFVYKLKYGLSVVQEAQLPLITNGVVLGH